MSSLPLEKSQNHNSVTGEAGGPRWRQGPDTFVLSQKQIEGSREGHIGDSKRLITWTCWRPCLLMMFLSCSDWDPQLGPGQTLEEEIKPRTDKVVGSPCSISSLQPVCLLILHRCLRLCKLLQSYVFPASSVQSALNLRDPSLCHLDGESSHFLRRL